MDEGRLMTEFKRVYCGKKENLDDAILELRLMGASPIDSIKVIRKCLGIGLKEADDLLLNSVGWRDIKTGTLQLRGTADNILADSRTDIIESNDKGDLNKSWWKSVSAFVTNILRKLRIR